MDLSAEVRGEEVWVNLAEVLSFMLEGSEVFLQEHGHTTPREFNSGFVTGIKGLVEAFAEFGLTKVEMSKLETVDDFMELTK